MTETIDLNQFNDIQISEDGTVGQFELIEGEKGNINTKKKRVFVADSMKELDEWYNAFTLRMNINKKSRPS